MGNEPTPDEPPKDDLSDLESQFAGSEERIVGDHIIDAANDIKALLRGILPAGSFPGLDEDVDPGLLSPEMGLDGEPIITKPPQAEAILLERPELAEQVDATTYRLVGHKRQQHGIDVEAAGDDTERLAQLDSEWAKLVTEEQDVRFAATVIALHCPSAGYMVDNLPSYKGWNGFDGKTKLFFTILREAARIDRTLREELETETINLGRIDATLALDGIEDWWRERLGFVRKEVLRRDHYRAVLRDIMLGRARPAHEPVDFGDTPNSSVDPPEIIAEDDGQHPNLKLYELLADVPGIDPVTATVEGKLSDLPRAGWVIAAEINPGAQAQLHIQQFPGNAFRVTDRYESPGSSTIRIGYSIQGAARYSVGFQKDDGKGNTQTPSGMGYVKSDIIPCHNNRVLVCQTRPMAYVANTGDAYLYRQDLQEAMQKYAQNPDYLYSTKYQLARISDDPQEVRAILDTIGKSMGLDEAELQQLMEKLTDKKVFEPLWKDDQDTEN